VDERVFVIRTPVPFARQEEILDLAAALQLRRREVADRLAAGDDVDAEIYGRGVGEINGRLLVESQDWAEYRSLRPRITSAQLRYTIPPTRSSVAKGNRVISVFDQHGVDATGATLLAAEDPAVFRLSVVPVQVKLIYRDALLLQGPFIDEEVTVMMVRDRGCLAAAWRYWNAVADASYEPRRDLPGLDGLTPRQCAIVGMLGDDATDETIAAALDVSVRTVRYDIARVLELLGVRSRFAAGQRVRDLLGRREPARQDVTR